MNIIDRDKLIEDLLNQDENNIYVPWAMIKGFINDYVMKQPTVNQWIPRKERLPEENEEVYVTLVNYTGERMTSVDVFENGNFYHHSKKVIAWQSLPKPYEEKENE